MSVIQPMLERRKTVHSAERRADEMRREINLPQKKKESMSVTACSVSQLVTTTPQAGLT